MYEDSDEDGEGNSWRGDLWGGCSSAGFCSGEAELEAARRSWTVLVCRCEGYEVRRGRTHQVFEPLLELLAVVALGNAVLYPPALSEI